MTESPAISMIRGFVVYLTFMAGIMIATDRPFGGGDAGSSGTSPTTLTSASPQVVAGSVTYIRYAGFVSLLAFVAGYDPTRFESLLRNVPLLGTAGPSAASPRPSPPSQTPTDADRK